MTAELFDTPESLSPQSSMIGPLRDAVDKAQRDALAAISAARAVDDLGWEWSEVIWPVEELSELQSDADCFDETAYSIDLRECDWDHMSESKRKQVHAAMINCRDSIKKLIDCINALEIAEKKQIQDALNP